MVQYIITPWRDRHELVKVRNSFYPGPESNEVSNEDRIKAVATVSVWVQRGNCPHLVESTAILVSVMINDEVGNSAYGIRAAYSAAFCRFVTGLLDGYQDKRHKLSMYSIAKNIGLPSTFVELRHQCTHEELPSLSRLRAAAQSALAWIWERYWQTIEVPQISSNTDACRKVLQEYLRWRARADPDVTQERKYKRRLRKWDTALIMEVLSEFCESDSMDTSIVLQSVKLWREILSEDENSVASDSYATSKRNSHKLDHIRAEMALTRDALRAVDDPTQDSEREHMVPDTEMLGEGQGKTFEGWAMWTGPWKSKPIGVV